jgi:hypothetical protein
MHPRWYYLQASDDREECNEYTPVKVDAGLTGYNGPLASADEDTLLSHAGMITARLSSYP